MAEIKSPPAENVKRTFLRQWLLARIPRFRPPPAKLCYSCPARKFEITHHKPENALRTRFSRRRRTQIAHAADVRESLDELAELARPPARKSSAKASENGIARRRHFIGKGKAEEFAKFLQKGMTWTRSSSTTNFRPRKARNLEKIFGCKIMDRTALILEIFRQRARTREGKLQIEHAQLKYLLPRLTRFWSHLSRQRGSTGSIGGEGESQLEADRRKFPSASKNRGANSTPSAASARRSAPAASAATGRSPPSSVTRTRANPLCSTRSPARPCWPRTNCSPRSTRRRGV
jgi:hypothetical protein